VGAVRLLDRGQRQTRLLVSASYCRIMSALIRPRSDTARPAFRAQAPTAARSTRCAAERPAGLRARLTRRETAMNGASESDSRVLFGSARSIS